MKHNNNRSRKLLMALLIVIISLFLIGMIVRWIRWNNLESPPDLTFRARTQVIAPETEDITLMLPGYLVAYNVTPILSRTNGYLKSFYHDIGDIVKANDLLATIETPDVDAELAQAKADYERAIARRDLSKITAQRWSGLYNEDSESIAKQEVDVTSADLESAIADVNAATARVQRLQVLHDFKYITAPFDGIVVERNIDIGSLISVGNENMTQPYTIGYETLTQPLFKIARIDTLRVFVEVPQPYYPYIIDGVQAEVSVPEHPDRIFKGTIVRNATALDQSSRTLLTQINIENENNLLRPGLYTEVRFTFKPQSDSFNIPIGALIIRNGPPLVASVDENDLVKIHEVKIGRDYGKSVQIVKGLTARQRIILNPNYRVKDGLKVKIVDKELPKTDD